LRFVRGNIASDVGRRPLALDRRPCRRPVGRAVRRSLPFPSDCCDTGPNRLSTPPRRWPVVPSARPASTRHAQAQVGSACQSGPPILPGSNHPEAKV